MKEKIKEVMSFVDSTLERMINDNNFIVLESATSVLKDKFDIYYETTCDGRDAFIVTFSRNGDGYSCKISFVNHLHNTIEREIIMKNEDAFMAKIPDFLLRNLRDYLAK